MQDDIVLCYSQIDPKEPDQRFYKSSFNRSNSLFANFMQPQQPSILDSVAFNPSDREVLSSVNKSVKVSIDFDKQISRQTNNVLFPSKKKQKPLKKGDYVNFLPNSVLKQFKRNIQK